MVQCWDANPRQRPSFEQLVTAIDNVIAALMRARNVSGDRQTIVPGPCANPQSASTTSSTTSDPIVVDYLTPNPCGLLLEQHPLQHRQQQHPHPHLHHHHHHPMTALHIVNEAKAAETTTLRSTDNSLRPRRRLSSEAVVYDIDEAVSPTETFDEGPSLFMRRRRRRGDMSDSGVICINTGDTTGGGSLTDETSSCADSINSPRRHGHTELFGIGHTQQLPLASPLSLCSEV